MIYVFLVAVGILIGAAGAWLWRKREVSILRRMIELYHIRQQRSWETANNLRGRLLRLRAWLDVHGTEVGICRAVSDETVDLR